MPEPSSRYPPLWKTGASLVAGLVEILDRRLRPEPHVIRNQERKVDSI